MQEKNNFINLHGSTMMDDTEVYYCKNCKMMLYAPSGEEIEGHNHWVCWNRDEEDV